MNHSYCYEKVKKILDQTISHAQIVTIGVSGGADSMYLLYCIQQWRDQKKRETTSLHIVSCDHNTRDNTKNEVETVKKQCKKNIFYSAKYTGNIFTEQALRLRRHTAFITYCKANNSKLLLLGHHFDDRIETTFLNINRGCGQEGLQGLAISTPHFLDKTLTLVRPLLTLQKNEIIEECDRLHIPYHIDPTNHDPKYSKRNTMRQLLQKEFNTPGFYRSLEQLYKSLKPCPMPQNNQNQSIESNGKTYQLYHDKTGQYIITTKTGEWTSDIIYQIYQLLHISINPRSTTLENLSEILNKKSGNKITYNNITIKSFQYSSVIILDSGGI